MATDPRVSAIDAALYRLSPPTTPYSTPFTYNNGLTVLEILERIRQAVIDTITYAEGFGKEVEGMVKEINKIAEQWSKDSKKKLDDFEVFLNDSRNSTDAKIRAMNELIESFKARLVDARFDRIENGDYVDAPMKDSSRIQVVTKQRAEKIDAAVERVKSDVRTILATYYTKTEADDKFLEDPKLTEGVVFGSSNATIEASRWTEQLCRDMGVNPNVFAIGGGGFTSTPDNNFITQVNNARSRMSDEKKRATKYVFLIDMLNDIRAQNSVTEQAGTFFSLVRQYFPNATIYVLPVTYNEASLNEYVQMARSCVSRTYEVINAGKAYGAIVCEGSRSWLHFGKEQAKSWDQGVDNVHMTDAGYRHVRQLFVNWIHGGPSFLNPPSYDLHPLSASTVARDYNYLNCERHGDFVNIQGTFRVAGTDVGYDAKLMDLPGWARPYDGMMSPIIGNDRTYKYVYVAKTGGMHAGDILKANQTYQVNMTYRIF
jgi:lysophospholipase L1-like esterase